MKRQSRKHRLLVSLCSISLIACLWLGSVTSNTVQFQIGEVTNAQNSASSQWVREGVEKYQSGEFLGAIEVWNKALNIDKNNSNPRNKAIIHENLARAYQEVGQTTNAIENWQEVVKLHRQLGDAPKLGRSLTELAQVYSSYGQPQKAIGLLCNSKNIDNCQPGSAVQIAKVEGDSEGEVAAWGSLGDAYLLSEGCEDDTCRAIKSLYTAQKILKEEENKNYEISILNSLANVYTHRASLSYRRALILENQGDDNDDKVKDAKKNYDEALNKLEKSLAIAKQADNKLAAIKILLNQITINKRLGKNTEDIWKEARELSKTFPSNSQKVYTYITLADMGLSNSKTFSEVEDILKDAKNIARQIKDKRAESFALGKLGKLYESSKIYDKALGYTKKAREVIEQDLQGKDSLFLWEWQTAKILKEQNKIDEAIIAYKNARYSLEKVRQDILSENRNFQFDFRDEVEPIYRELLTLQLNSKSEQSYNKTNKQNTLDLIDELETMDSLKIGELQNYFGSDCILIPKEDYQDKSKKLSKKDKFTKQLRTLIGDDKQTAIFSSIILDNKTAIILTFSNGESVIKWIHINKQDLTRKLSNYRQQMEKSNLLGSNYRQFAIELYNLIIKPFEEDENYLQLLQSSSENPATLLFVQDGIFQTIPMAALFDEKTEKYLVQKYAIVATPSILLLDRNNSKINNLKVLAFGLNEDKIIDDIPFEGLSYVEKEINLIPNNKPLINEKFNRKNLEQELNKQTYSVIHMATHGKAGVEPKDTFILTGEKGKEKLTITELDKIIRGATKRQNRIDLLAITACESAVGDERSALGIAGIAVQAGAKSTLASLWSVDDERTADLSIKFYTDLNNSDITKAQALRNAQMMFIESKDSPSPYFWAPFVLVGKWQ